MTTPTRPNPLKIQFPTSTTHRFFRRSIGWLFVVATVSLQASVISLEPVAPSGDTYAEALAAARADHDEEVTLARAEGKDHATPFAPLSEALFVRLFGVEGPEVLRFTYWSDGLKVKGYLWKPRHTQGRRLPVVIFNRGGNREFGKLEPWMITPLMLAANDFVVIGSQYRGVDGGEGTEEFGGADVNDILNLQSVIRKLDYADAENMFMHGGSRGGMMTYLALRRGTLPIRAASISGALVDLVAEAARRPGLVEGVWRHLMPGFAENPDGVMRERSPIQWAHEVATPMLILHGGADWRADPASSLILAQRLQAARRTYQLVIYAGDDHGLTVNREQRVQMMTDWFRQHLKRK